FVLLLNSCGGGGGGGGSTPAAANYVAYVADNINTNGLASAFSINAATGALTQISGSPFTAGANPNSVAVDPSGEFAYVANSASTSISGYTITPSTGALTAIAGSPFSAPVGSLPRAVTVHPNGKFL